MHRAKAKYIFFLRICRPPRSTRTHALFPSTTLFRSEVERPRIRLAVIGEPEAAMGIEDDVVGATQRRAGGLGVERLDRTAGDIDALDRPAGIIGGGAVRDQQPKIGRAHV